MSNIVSLKDHQDALCRKADELIGEAIMLRFKLRNEISLPFPEKELEELLAALATFVRAAEKFPR